MTEYKMCANEDMAIYILEFIKREYEKSYQDAGVQKYIEALQMGIDALATVDRQKAEVERLKSMNQAKLDTIHDLMAEIERLQNESIGNCEMAIAMRSDHNLDVDCNYCIDKAKSEAYKEIVKKLKEHLCSYDLPNYYSFEAVDEDTIDEVLKELVGENNG